MRWMLSMAEPTMAEIWGSPLTLGGQVVAVIETMEVEEEEAMEEIVGMIAGMSRLSWSYWTWDTPRRSRSDSRDRYRRSRSDSRDRGRDRRRSRSDSRDRRDSRKERSYSRGRSGILTEMVTIQHFHNLYPLRIQEQEQIPLIATWKKIKILVPFLFYRNSNFETVLLLRIIGHFVCNFQNLDPKAKMSYRRPPQDVDRMTSLRVDNLPYRTHPEVLKGFKFSFCSPTLFRIWNHFLTSLVILEISTCRLSVGPGGPEDLLLFASTTNVMPR